MGSHPVNLAIRFLLELAVLGVMGYWGYKQGDGGMRYVWLIVIPILAAAVWGTFAVLDDPSRSGNAPVPVTGIIRLLIELVFFAAAVWMLYDLKYTSYSLIVGSTVIVHYLVSYDRIIWLLER